jgi:peptidoglycan/xylan/chitin deacetylase (PgdA/CDA1 family)
VSGPRRPDGWGPARRRAAVAVTFDNLGEVTELERGEWPAAAPLGRHFSVCRALPRVLALLAEQELRATFFVEGLNTELYPDALRTIAAGGHEVAYHGWRHEPWAGLGAAEERALLTRGAEALAALSLRPVGMRPPGGGLTAATLSALADLGFTYCSPAGRGAGVRAGLALLPFRWELIDAFHYLPRFGDRRRAARGADDPLPPGVLRRTLATALDATARDGGLLVLLFHPFLAGGGERFDALAAVLRDVRARVADGAVWSAPLRDIAAWVRAQPDAPAWAVELEGD